MSDDSDDFRAFRDAIGPVRRIRTERAESRPAPARPHPRMREHDEARVLDELAEAAPGVELLETGEELQWLRPGLQRRVLVRLRRGHWQVQDEIDLHQMNVEAATRSIRLFLDEALTAGRSCVKIIHGKGLRSGPAGPRLKSVTARILSRHPRVLAFTAARPGDGGSGATYVLLGQRR
ncbi:Smr/MutS family protein [Wenzhouxiangella sp. XN79A]|uniref:Smr/MutS family protein n=1 Tax=Wenzhouxiangella sp. XN79A TaxID=2724193 RepID=UPI00197DB26D|nr:Smr/MutS family protein [Wenzhouxiangella sp. XN79A]